MKNHKGNEMDIFEIQKLIESMKVQFNEILKPLNATIHYTDEGELLNSPGYDKRVIQISLSPSGGIQPQLWDVDLKIIEMEGTTFNVEIEVFINNIIELIRELSKLDVIGYYLVSKNNIALFIAKDNQIPSIVHSKFNPVDWRKELKKAYPGLKVFPKNE